jgi:hypothetical protein
MDLQNPLLVYPNGGTLDPADHAREALLYYPGLLLIAEISFGNSFLCTARMIAVSACSLSSAVIGSFFLSLLLALHLLAKRKQHAMTVTKRLYFEILSKNLIFISGSNCDTIRPHIALLLVY